MIFTISAQEPRLKSHRKQEAHTLRLFGKTKTVCLSILCIQTCMCICIYLLHLY